MLRGLQEYHPQTKTNVMSLETLFLRFLLYSSGYKSRKRQSYTELILKKGVLLFFWGVPQVPEPKPCCSCDCRHVIKLIVKQNILGIKISQSFM